VSIVRLVLVNVGRAVMVGQDRCPPTCDLRATIRKNPADNNQGRRFSPFPVEPAPNPTPSRDHHAGTRAILPESFRGRDTWGEPQRREQVDEKQLLSTERFSTFGPTHTNMRIALPCKL
jgi:hypothetical protein